LDKQVRLLHLLLFALLVCGGALAQGPQDTASRPQEPDAQVASDKTPAEAAPAWIATVETVTKSGGQETKSNKKIWHKGLKERVEEEVQGGVSTTIIDAESGHRTVIEPGGKYAMMYALPEKGKAFYQQRESAGMARALRDQGFEVTGPDEVDQEEILGIPCVVRELTATTTDEMRKENPKIPELMMFRLWEPKEPAGLPEALKLAQVIKDMQVTEFVFTSLQRDPVMDDALFEVPEGMSVYDYTTSLESVRERITKTREEYLKKQKEESGGGSEGSGSGNSGTGGGDSGTGDSGNGN
jgi:hypothetical protein